MGSRFTSASFQHRTKRNGRRGFGRRCIREHFRTQRQAAGHQDSEATIAGMVEAPAAMFEGLRIRTIRNPDLDQTAVVQVFRRMIHDLLSQTP